LFNNMQTLANIRSGKPGFYPDQSIYAAYCCTKLGLRFEDADGGTGLVFSVGSKTRRVYFGAGRCAWYPQNNATAATLASDKYFTNVILERAGLPTLGGEYFFLHERHRAHRAPGHETSDARNYFRKLGAMAFAKPLLGSRGDFAQSISGEAALASYIGEVSRYYDSILIQPIVSGAEYRIFILDDDVLYTARKYPPYLLGDGVRSVRDLLASHNTALQARGLSAAVMTTETDHSLDAVPAKGERWEIPGRMNLSAGGTMVLEEVRSDILPALAKKAVRALGLRVAAVDLFADISHPAGASAVIEVNSNPSIRLLEESGRDDLILKIWQHTFSVMGLL
jgi:glutathione synthase/RimK-type ligase-like ATP-grasp enzyme